MTTVGYGDITLLHSGTLAKLVGIGLILSSRPADRRSPTAMPDAAAFYRRVITGYKLNLLGIGTVDAIEGFDLDALQRHCSQVARVAREGEVHACYEASGAGYVLHRALRDWGYACEVIAPSLIPKRSGVHRKHDKRDAADLARGPVPFALEGLLRALGERGGGGHDDRGMQPVAHRHQRRADVRGHRQDAGNVEHCVWVGVVDDVAADLPAAALAVEGVLGAEGAAANGSSHATPEDAAAGVTGTPFVPSGS